MLLLRRLLHQNRKQLLLLLLPRNPQFLRQIFLHPQNQKSLLLLQKENGKARAASSLRERNPKGRARAAGKARAAAGRDSPAASNPAESVPKVRAAGRDSPAEAGKVSLVASSQRVNGPKGMVRAAAGKGSPVDSNPAANGRDSLADLSRGPKDRASDRVQRARVVVSDLGAKVPKCHRR